MEAFPAPPCVCRTAVFCFAAVVGAVLRVGLALLVVLFIVVVTAAAHFYAAAPFVLAGVDVPRSDSVASGAVASSNWLATSIAAST